MQNIFMIIIVYLQIIKMVNVIYCILHTVQIWQQVKGCNPGMSVCEVGSTIGGLWREMSSEEKQRHNDDFCLDKVGYRPRYLSSRAVYVYM